MDVAYELRFPTPAVRAAHDFERNLHRHRVSAGMHGAVRFPRRLVRRVFRRRFVVRPVRRRLELIEISARAARPKIDPNRVVVSLADVIAVLNGGDWLALHRIEPDVDECAVAGDPYVRGFTRAAPLNDVPTKRERTGVSPHRRGRRGVERRCILRDGNSKTYHG